MSETGTTRDLTTLRALSLAMSILALMSWGTFAYGISALGGSPAGVERASGQAEVSAESALHRAG